MHALCCKSRPAPYPPTPRTAQAYAASVGKSAEAGNLRVISMGQGQEAPAEAALDLFMAQGGWVVLDNVHLMQVCTCVWGGWGCGVWGGGGDGVG